MIQSISLLHFLLISRENQEFSDASGMVKREHWKEEGHGAVSYQQNRHQHTATSLKSVSYSVNFSPS